MKEKCINGYSAVWSLAKIILWAIKLPEMSCVGNAGASIETL